MPTYEQVNNAGDIDGQHVYKVRFGVNPCSDMPQLQAWDDHDMNTVNVESLQGTVNNGGVSQIAAAHTTNINTGGPWAPATMDEGGGQMQDPNAVGTAHRANRLRGNEGYLLLGDAGDSPPIADEEREFQLAFMAHDDSGTGTSGHRPVLGVKTFYAGAPPDVDFYYNRGTEGAPDWVAMTSSDKGTPMAIGVLNTIHATGPATTVTALDPVTKPGSGEKAAEEQWVQTAL
jgi:hypothetical protein